MDKKEIRRAVKQAILALSPAERELQEQRVVASLCSIIAERKPRVVALFAPLGDEVQILPLVENLPRDCRLLLPRVVDTADGTPSMEFYDYNASALTVGSYGIMEPQGTVACAVEEIDLMVVPGVAFSADGVRLGRGKGYYDRYIARKGFRAYTIGVCYDCQMLGQLPCDEHDRRVDSVIYPLY